jgi:CRISPR/Cas system CSM-associated protein Csm5 (group 7 of RAMP superfamily)
VQKEFEINANKCIFSLDSTSNKCKIEDINKQKGRTNMSNQVTLKISQKDLMEVLSQGIPSGSIKKASDLVRGERSISHRLAYGSPKTIDHVMRVLRHEYSDYDQQWKSGDWKLTSKSFAVEFVMVLGGFEPQNTSDFANVATKWMKRENRA